jgi:hypothetical protein
MKKDQVLNLFLFPRKTLFFPHDAATALRCQNPKPFWAQNDSVRFKEELSETVKPQITILFKDCKKSYL